MSEKASDRPKHTGAPEDYVVATPVQGPISMREQGYRAGYADAKTDYEANRAEVAALRQQLDEALAWRESVNAAIREAGITYPAGARAVRDLAAMASGRLEELQTAEADRDRLLVVYRAAEELAGFLEKSAGVLPHGTLAALYQLDAALRSAAPAEPVPGDGGVPVDTEEADRG